MFVCVALTYQSPLHMVAGLMHLPHEQLQSNDGIDDNDKQHQQGNMQQRDHGLDN